MKGLTGFKIGFPVVTKGPAFNRFSIGKEKLWNNSSSYRAKYFRGGSPGQVVKGGDSYSRDCGFESHLRILDGQFPLICCKIVLPI